MPHPTQMSALDAALLVVDVQEKLLPLIPDARPLVRDVAFLLDAAALLGLPVQATEQYRSAVIAAFQNVADTLAALEHDANALKAAAASAQAAAATLEVVRAQQRSGYASYLQLFSAEQTYQAAVITRLQAQTNRFTDTAALFQALGGGWWNRGDPRLGDLAGNPNPITMIGPQPPGSIAK